MSILALLSGAARAAMPAVGQPAPAFQSVDQDGRPIALADFKGHPVVLYFYPKDETPGCTRKPAVSGMGTQPSRPRVP